MGEWHSVPSVQLPSLPNLSRHRIELGVIAFLIEFSTPFHQTKFNISSQLKVVMTGIDQPLTYLYIYSMTLIMFHLLPNRTAPLNLIYCPPPSPQLTHSP